VLSCAHTLAVTASAASIDVCAHFNGFVQMCLLSRNAPPEHTRNVSKSLAERHRFVCSVNLGIDPRDGE